LSDRGIRWPHIYPWERPWLIGCSVAIVLVLSLGSAAGLALGYFVLPYHAPGSKAVELREVSYRGPMVDMGGVLAAPSLVDLTTLANAVTRLPEETCSPLTCWPDASIPKSSLLIALPTILNPSDAKVERQIVPVFCFRYALSADLSSGNALEIQIVVGAFECMRGGMALDGPAYWLLAVPLDELPASALSVNVFVRSQRLGADPDRTTPVLRTAVDLRRPLQTADGSVTAAAVEASVDAARRDAEQGRHAGRTSIVGLGLFRWPAGESLCTTPSGDPTSDRWGSFVTLTDYGTSFDYRSNGVQTVFCGSHPY
jgi:hypothetical protein